MNPNQLDDAFGTLQRIEAQLAQALLGNRAAIRIVVATIAAGGHLLLQDEPGVGKTLLARAIARSIGGSFARVQGSPDLLPADVTGINIPDPTSGEWTFRPGPVLNNVVLFDELNRSTSRAQSALFEAMAERQVTVDGVTRMMPTPFVVVATQNPSSHAGTFPLPEGQLDRFWTTVMLEAPSRSIERDLITSVPGYERADALEPVTDLGSLLAVQQRVARISVAAPVVDYALDLVDRLRTINSEPVVPSPRASQMLAAVARGHACLSGRDTVIPDDVKAVAGPTLAHRLDSGKNLGAAYQIVAQVLDEIEVPVPA